MSLCISHELSSKLEERDEMRGDELAIVKHYGGGVRIQAVFDPVIIINH